MKKKYKLRAVVRNHKGSLTYRIEIFNYPGWIDALQGSFDTKEDAERHIKEMNDEPIQETLL